MSVPLDAETELLLNAYVDGELDPASMIAFGRRLDAEPGLAAARDRLVALRGSLRESLVPEPAPERLRRAMLAQAGLTGQNGPVGRPAFRGRPALARLSPAPPWRLALAASLLGALFGAGVTAFVSASAPSSLAGAEVVSDHLRAVMAPQPFDVASSDQHTVKPWFTGRLPFAPKVFDLAKDGFPLAGGRVDVVGGQPAATLVFRHDKHLISLTSQPTESPGGAGDDRSVKGFLVRAWTSGGMRYWAVSDVAPEELDAFVAAARAAIGDAG